MKRYNIKQIDHVIPLNGDIVSGLNSVSNLQYLNPKENGVKSNKFDGTVDNNTWRKLLI